MRNSTILVKKKKCINCYELTYIFSKGRCRQCATIEDFSKRVAKAETEVDDDLPDLIADVDYWFSRYIRLKYADVNGQVECYTSGKRMDWKTAQCGHYISRQHIATRWLPQNVRVQSQQDNCVLSGNLDVFKRKLEEETPGITEWLLEQSRQVCKMSREEMKELLIDYRSKAKMLEKKLKK